jgi:hypothetical protein
MPTRQQFLKWAVPVGVGVVGVTIASQFLGKQSQQPPPETPTSSESPSPSPIDYAKLEEFLKAGQLKEANEETINLMLSFSNKEQLRNLNADSVLGTDMVKKFPCDVLRRIDDLWIANSEGKFGFSVQRKIYVEDCGGKLDGEYDEETWQCLGNKVGWRMNNQWINRESLTFTNSALEGHLPATFVALGFHLRLSERQMTIYGLRGNMEKFLERFDLCRSV